MPSRRVALRDRWSGSFIGTGARRFRELELDTQAVAFCAQQVLCTAPLAVAMSAVLQHARRSGIGGVLGKFFGLKGDASEAVQRLFDHPGSTISATALVVSLIVAVVFSTGVGAVQQRTFELVWTQPARRGVRSYLRQLAWAGGLAVYIAGLVVVTRWGRDLGHYVGANVLTSNVFEGVLTALFYWWSQRWLLAGRVGWRALLPGSVAVGVATILLVRVSRAIVPGQISWQVNAYGQVGIVIVLSAWLMVLSAVIFGAVLVGALITERRRV